jgi:hypothetical protein
MRRFCLTIIATLATARAAGAQPMPPQIQESGAPPVAAPRWTLAAGVRTLFVKDPGLDPFSTDDALPQFSLTGTGAILRRDSLALAAGLELDAGSSTATARFASTRLALTTFSVIVEGQYQPARRVNLFARLSPGLLHGAASMADASAPAGAELGTTFNTFSLEAAAGGAFCIAVLPGTRAGLWLSADGGYAWAAAQQMVLAPSLGADQNKAGAQNLGTLAPRGGFFRIALGLSY